MTFLSLYRKYRPRKFGDLVGQRHVVRTLQNALKYNRVAHAYLFAGPRGTGKTSAAKVFAQALNCPDRDSVEPCGECDNCRRIQSGQSIDVIEIDAASNRGIDEIRDLREKVKFYPSEGAYKVYIIDEVHMLTKGAFNALLKTLEEPPENVVFILATTEPHKVIDTILSRCQRYDFSLLSLEDIKGRLEYICQQEEVDFAEEALNIITRSSNGGMRDAISLLDQAISFTNARITADEVQQMLGKVAQEELNLFFKWIIDNNVVEALELVNMLIERGNSISVFVADLIEHTRRLLLVKECGLNSSIFNYPDELLAGLQIEAEKAGTARLFRVLEILTGIERNLTFTDQPRLVLEMGVMKMAAPAADSDLEGLQARLALLEERLDRLSAGEDISARPAAGREKPEQKAENESVPETGNLPEKAEQPDISRERSEIIRKQQGDAGDGVSQKQSGESTARPESPEVESEVKPETPAAGSKIEPGTPAVVSRAEQETPEVASERPAVLPGQGEESRASQDEIEKQNEAAGSLSLNKVQELWPEVLARVKDENISVQAYLLEGRPVMSRGELLKIEFPADKGFHRKGAEKESGLIKKVISQLLGQPCQLEFVTPGDDKAPKTKKKPRINKEEGLVDQIVKLFDGEIIKVDYSVLGENENSQEGN